MRKFGWFTVGFTYLLMVWGNLVSATGSGLACPDWPLCHGTVTPPPSVEVVLEWGHRLLAATTTILILTTLFFAFRGREALSQSRDSALKRSGRFLMGLIVVQILLGGLTVMLKLSIVASTVHLLIANLVFGALIAIASAMSWKDPSAETSSPKVRRLAMAGLGGMLVQLALGGMVRHGHAGLACPFFPNCLEGFFPIPFGFETAVAFLHRWWGILLLGVFVQILTASIKTSPKLFRPARTALILALAQVFLGIGTVLSGIHVPTRAIHAAIGYLLWGVLFYIAVRAGAIKWLYDRNPETHVSGLAQAPSA